MTPHQKALVETSWALVTPISDTAADIFYQTLFEMDPSAKSLFSGNMNDQKQNLMRMISMSVRMLGRLDELVPVLQDLGVRHIDYGVTAAHYNTVGAALLSTLEKGLGDHFTPEVKDAWTVVYGVIATTMQDAAAQSQQQAVGH